MAPIVLLTGRIGSEMALISTFKVLDIWRSGVCYEHVFE